jgi:hypothetical protein
VCSTVRPVNAADAGQPAQCLTASGETRTDCPDRDIENRGNFSVTHSLQSNEQDYRSLIHREFGDSTLKIAQFKSSPLLRRTSEKRFALIQSDRCSFSRGSPKVINVLVVKYREQPRPQVRPLSPQMQFLERPSQAVLDEIVCGDGVAGERPRVASKTRNFGLDVPKSAGHRGLLPLATIGQGPIPSPQRLPLGCYPMMSARPILCKNL